MTTASADTGSGESYTDDILAALGGEFGGLLDGLSQNQIDFFGGSDFMSVLTNVVNGNFTFDYGNLFSFLLSLVGVSISDLLALLAVVIAIAVVYSILGALKGRSSSESVGKIIHFASVAAVIAVLGTTTVGMFDACKKTLDAIALLINILLPVMLTLMAAVGASASSAVFQPAVAVIASGLFNLLGMVLLPMLIAAFVFDVAGNLTTEVKLAKVSDFLGSAVKWLFGTGFFLMSAFLSVQGITASVFDGMSVRSAKFSVGKFVPVIGGYLAEGVNLIVSGGIVVKNALGYTAIILLVATVLPVIVKIAVFSLCLKLAAAVVEPLGDKLTCNLLTGLGKTVGLTGALMAGAAFLTFLFVLIVVSAGNVLS